MNHYGYLRIKQPADLRPRDVILGRVGHKMFPQSKTVLERPESRARVAEQSVIKIQDQPLMFCSQQARLVVVSEW